MMTRVEITLGLLSMIGVMIVTAIVGIGEYGDHGRMARAELGYKSRSVEAGAQMFEQYCASCHGANASGLNCPTLDEFSGIHGGDLGEGVAWRLEEVNWAKGDPYGYVESIIKAGRTVSTRPDQYDGGLGEGAMHMPAWSQDYAGPLRPDQVRDIANYVVNFRDYFPASSEPDAYTKACRQVLDQFDANPAIQPTTPGYTSKCYEQVCKADFKEADIDIEKAIGEEPEQPEELKTLSTSSEEYIELNAEYEADLEAYWDKFWTRCERNGSRIPPVAEEPEPEPEPTATAVEDDEASDEDADSESDADSETDADADADADTDADSETDSESDTDADADEEDSDSDADSDEEDATPEPTEDS